MKNCLHCNLMKAEACFGFDNKAKSSKVKVTCKDCVNLARRNQYKLDGGKRREQMKNLKMTPGGRYTRFLEDTKKRNINVSITKTDYINLISKDCFYCENKLGEKTKYGVGLDRLNNSLGYELTNVVPCCNFCNNVKGFLLTANEMKRTAMLLISLRSSPVNVSDIKRSLTKSRKTPLI